MLKIRYRKQFKKDYKRTVQRPGHKPELFQDVLEILVKEQVLPIKYRDHALSGDYIGFRECHILPDWLLIYRQTDTELYLVATGTHSDLFGL